MHASDLRDFTIDAGFGGPFTVYTVPAGKIFVVCSWTNYTAQTEAWLRRSGTRVTYTHVAQLNSYDHKTYPCGIAFRAGDTVEIEAAGGIRSTGTKSTIEGRTSVARREEAREHGSGDI
ncbi:hypothetical protein [Nannocystis punicea]|uniref:Uncharacterized protein n=1 Tax=Nannocystis punicea TaxID=2995304 RepID=A0ABY7H572_9BACT|nr:hypothetical protein [Nannocystis poenicansa]WAS94422.1 hypothetical protein O0S08_50545 [Nannocystis poenicansa]